MQVIFGAQARPRNHEVDRSFLTCRVLNQELKMLFPINVKSASKVKYNSKFVQARVWTSNLMVLVQVLSTAAS